jgi:ribosomal protein S12 methylthiotransferase accessory factor YcaO
MSIDSPDTGKPGAAEMPIAAAQAVTEAAQGVTVDPAADRAKEIAAARRKASSNRVARFFLRSRRDRSADDRSSEPSQPSKPQTP